MTDQDKTDNDLALEALTHVLDVLGWIVMEPEGDKFVEGLVIGTPRYIAAWQEAMKKKKADLQ